MAARPEIHTCGLSQLSTGGQSPTVDIVFVHGLHGHPEKTWTYKSNSNALSLSFRKKKAAVVDAGSSPTETASRSICFWPLDLLAKDQASARVFTYGYDASVTHFFEVAASKAGLLEHADGLLQSLVSARQECLGRPLIFIAHSLGGLVVKRVLSCSHNASNRESPDQLDIVESTIGVLFFGTPHRGSSLAEAGMIAERLAHLLGFSTSREGLRGLTTNNSVLKMLCDDFNRVLDHYPLRITSYQETKGLSRFGLMSMDALVVSLESSAINHPKEQKVPLEADHRSMCRFAQSGETFQAYKMKVQAVVNRYIEDAGAHRPASQTYQPLQSSERLYEIREHLWEEANEKLKAMNPELYESYQHCMRSEAQRVVAPVTKSPRDGDERFLFDKADSIILSSIRNRKPTSASTATQGFIEKTAQIIQAIRPSVFTDVHSGSYTSAAWSSVCIILSLLLNDAIEHADAAKHVHHTTVVMLRFRHSDMLYGTGPHAAGFSHVIVPLYTYILECQALLLCRLSKHRIVAFYSGMNDKTKPGNRQFQTLEDEFQNWTKRVGAPEMANPIASGRENFRTKKTASKLNQLLQRLYSNYESDKDINTVRVPGTCEWFLGHINFLAWREKKISALLWVTGHPGCGKSVLSRHIIDHGGHILASSLEPVTVCYFFFKDGDSARTLGLNALRAMFHQLLLRKPSLFSVIEEDFDQKGEALLDDFDSLWKIFLTVAGSPDAGEIICVLDALDECEPVAREKLIEKLVTHYSDNQLSKNRSTRLKFIVTSRPYPVIEDSFHILTEASACIRLIGEDQSAQIGAEIDLVIDAKIPEITYKLDSVVRDALISQLKATKNRTYLWLRLIFELIKKKYHSMIMSYHDSTSRNLKQLIKLPLSVREAYKELLDKGDDPVFAKQILQFIIAAYRPLTVSEINTALAIDNTWDRQCDTVKICESESDLGHHLFREDSLRRRIKESCGLLVTIFDSKLYLIHQTVREYLLSDVESLPIGWQGSFDPKAFHRMLAKLCISYLVFPEFSQAPPPNPFERANSGDTRLMKWNSFLSAHPFLNYAGNYWMAHLSASDNSQLEHYEALMTLCDISSLHFATWYQVSRQTIWSRRAPLSSVYVAASMGIELVVETLLKHGRVDEHGDIAMTLGQAMFRAAEAGFSSIVKLLLDYGASSRSDEGWALIAASYHGFPQVVELLLNQKLSDLNIQKNYMRQRGTPLFFAAVRGHEDVVRLLLQRGAVPDTIIDDRASNEPATALSGAAMAGHKAIVEALLEFSANPNAGPKHSSAILCAAEQGFVDITRLLLTHNADVTGANSSSPLIAAVKGGYSDLVSHLLHRGAYINERTETGTALTMAVARNDLNMVQLLWRKGANLAFYGERTWEAKQLPLQLASKMGNIRMMEFLLEKGADINMLESNHSLTAIQWTVVAGMHDAFQFLIKKGADLDVPGALGTTLHVAIETGPLEILEYIMDIGADVNAGSPRQSIKDSLIPSYKDSGSGNALQRAVTLGKLDVVKILCKRGADINATNKFNDHFPLHIALSKGFRDIAVYLMQQNVDWNKQGVEAIKYMVARHYHQLLEDLYERLPDVINKVAETIVQITAEVGDVKKLDWILNLRPDLYQREAASVALRLAVREGHVDCVRFLLGCAVINLDTVGRCPSLIDHINLRHSYRRNDSRECSELLAEQGYVTALQLAAAGNHPEIIHLLVTHGATIDLFNEPGSAIQIAAYYGHSRCVQHLIENGADLNSKSGFRGSALQCAASLQLTRFEEPQFTGSQIREYIQTVRVLLANHSEIESDPGRRGTALQRAANSGVLEIVTALVQYGANVNADGGHLGTALQRAAFHGHLDVVNYLLANKADVDAPGGLFGTALQQAAENGHLSTVRALLKAGADVDAGCNGTPLQKAAARAHATVVRVLLQHHASVDTESGHCRVIDGLLTDNADAEHTCRVLMIRSRVRLGSMLHVLLDSVHSSDTRPSIETLHLLLAAGVQFTGTTWADDWNKALKLVSDMNELGLIQLVADCAPRLKDSDLLQPLVEAIKQGCTTTLQALLPKVESVSTFEKLSLSILDSSGSLDHESILSLAALHSHSEILTTLLDYGFDINLSSPSIRSPIESAASKGSQNSIRLLLKHKVDVRGVNGSAALIQAASSGYHEIVKQLLGEGACYSTSNSSDTALVAATKAGHEKVVIRFLEDAGASLSVLDLRSALSCARSRNFHPISWRLACHLKQCNFSLREFAEIERQRAERESELRDAARFGLQDKVAELLETGVHVDASPGGYGTALQWAAANGHLALTKTLLEAGANVQLTGGIYEDDDLAASGTALARAAAGGHTDICNLLLEYGANLLPDRSSCKMSPIERAAAMGHTDAVELLARSFPESVDTWMGSPGGTALQRAATNNEIEMARILLDVGADVNSHCGAQGTPLQFAAAHGHCDMARLLLDKGAAINNTGPKALSCTSLWLAVHNQEVAMVKLLIEKGADIELSFSGRDDVDLLDRILAWITGGMTPLQVAIDNKDTEIAKILLDAGVRADTRRIKHPWTAFQIAVCTGLTEIVALLVDRGDVDIDDPWPRNVYDEKGDSLMISPLQWAINEGMEEIADILKAKGAVAMLETLEDYFDRSYLRLG